MPLTQKQKKTLRTVAQKLRPVVIIGQNGLTENVLNEIELGIDHHELIKVKINSSDREQCRLLIRQIAVQTHSELIQEIGYTAVYYRRNPDRNRINPGLP